MQIFSIILAIVVFFYFTLLTIVIAESLAKDGFIETFQKIINFNKNKK
jgi:hypothetical protein